MVIDSAHGDHFDALYCKSDSSKDTTPRPSAGDSMLKSYFDGSASWFT